MTLRYLGFHGDTADLTAYTFAAADLGVPAEDRTIVVMGAVRGVNGCQSVAVTVAGVTATVDVATYFTGVGTCTFAAHAHVPHGMEGTVTVTVDATQLRCSIGVYSVGGRVTLAGGNTDDAPDYESAPVQSVGVPAAPAGFVLAHAFSAAPTAGWNMGADVAGVPVPELTEDFDNQYDGYARVAGLSLETDQGAWVWAWADAYYVNRYLLVVSYQVDPWWVGLPPALLFRHPSWVEAVTAKNRVIDSRAELVDPAGTVVVADLPLNTAEVDYNALSPETWAARVTLSDPVWVPDSYRHPLDPRAALRLRLWWRLRVRDDLWAEVLVCTVHLVDPEIDDDGLLSMSLTGRDVLAAPRASGYGANTVDVAGMTVDEAVTELFRVVAPTLPLRTTPSTVTLPDPYTLGLRTPGQDWAEIATLENWQVRSSREGNPHLGPLPTSPGVVASYQEGEDSLLLRVRRQVRNSDIVNSVTATGTHPDLEEPVTATVEDTDPASPTYIGGPFGLRNKPVQSDAIKDADAALNFAQAAYDELRRPYDTVTIDVPQRPDLNGGDQVAAGRTQAGVAGVYRVAGWTLTMPTRGTDPQDMPLRMIDRPAS